MLGCLLGGLQLAFVEKGRKGLVRSLIERRRLATLFGQPAGAFDQAFGLLRHFLLFQIGQKIGGLFVRGLGDGLENGGLGDPIVYEDDRHLLMFGPTSTGKTRRFLLVNLLKPGMEFAKLKEQPTTVYLILPAERLRTHGVWLRLVIVSALQALYKAGGLRTVLFIDEWRRSGI